MGVLEEIKLGSIKRHDLELALGYHWRSSEPEKDVELNACVVHDTKRDEYFIFCYNRP